MLIRLVLVLQQLFMLWMLVDAIRRRAEYYWFMVIFLPFGVWAYFFMVKIHDPELRWLREPFQFQKLPSLAELRARCDEAPSLLNRLNLAKGLHDAGEYGEALERLDEILARYPEEKEALYGRALCRASTGDPTGAISDLTELIELDRSFQDFQPWLHLARAYWDSQKQDRAVATVEELCRMSPRLEFELLLGRYLSAQGRTDEARARLSAALQDYARAPRFIKRRDWRAAIEARLLLRRLPQPPTAATA